MKQIVGILFFLVAGSTAAQSPVEVARVRIAETSMGQRIVGTVQPLRTSIVGSAVDGRVLEFDVNDGDPVRQGQRLAQLRTDTLQIQLAAAKAERDLARYQLEELENGSRPEEIAEAEANMLAAKAAKDNAANQLKRLQTLFASSAASDVDLEDAKERADASRFLLMASESLFQRIKQGPRREQIAQGEARVELQTQRVNLLEDQLEKLTIVSPLDGFVAAEFTEVGAWISQGDPVAQVVQLDEVEIQVPVPAQQAVRVHAGDVIRVEFPELPDQLFVGSVDRIVPIAESRARTFPVYIRMKNQFNDGKPTLLAGMLARVELPAGRRRNMPLVPKDALVLNGADRSVFVIETSAGDGGEGESSTATVRKVTVDLGVAVEGLIQVSGDLDQDDLVVVTGNERLVPGSEIKIVRTLETQIAP